MKLHRHREHNYLKKLTRLQAYEVWLPEPLASRVLLGFDADAAGEQAAYTLVGGRGDENPADWRPRG